ncbi:macrophage mannose receptor 1-like [Eriocheir sinensis]|uniref:macrophage mannose receptor 1-like n=1 Tax=Eriocheir sinensis TaxID=95602 RepID=UPI0021CAE1F8|nr:macrophage mannose receptor 1-like [Eriocheir sinensis]
MLSLLLVAGQVATSLSSPFPAVREYPRLKCSGGWELIDGTCFLLADASGTWDAGHSFCSQRGAFLATVSTHTQQNTIKAMLSQSVWIGLLYLKEGHSFGWVDGSQHSYTSWNGGEPNNHGVPRGLGGTENCVEMRDDFGYMWNDDRCDEIKQFLCSRPPEETTTPNPTPAAVCEEGWDMFNAMCYKVSDGQASWPTAREACLDQGAQLAAVTSEGQHHFLVARLLSIGSAWIGLNDRVEEGTFTWADGTKPRYTNWHDREPNNLGVGEDCVEIKSVGRYMWNDLPCDAERRFVCQKPPSVRPVSFPQAWQQCLPSSDAIFRV